MPRLRQNWLKSPGKYALTGRMKLSFEIQRLKLTKDILLAGSLLAAITMPASATPGLMGPAPVRAHFAPGIGVLTVHGDMNDNVITIGSDAAGKILVNAGDVRIAGGMPILANTVRIEVRAHQGDDQIWAEEFNGALPPVHFFGGDGDDLLVGGSSNDYLDGGRGNDTLAGENGDDTVVAGDGTDVLVWNPENGSDQMDGGDGLDIDHLQCRRVQRDYQPFRPGRAD